MAKDNPRDRVDRLLFSTNLNKFMADKGVRQIDLHNATGIPKSTITGYVKGTSLPNAGNLQKIADFLNIKKSDLDPRFITPHPEEALAEITLVQKMVTDAFENHIANFPFTAEEKEKLLAIKDDLIFFFRNQIIKFGYSRSGINAYYVTDRMEGIADFLTGDYDISSVFDIVYSHFGYSTIHEELQELMKINILETHKLENSEQMALSKILEAFKR